MIVTESNYEPALARAAVNAAVRAGWTAVPGELVVLLRHWMCRDLPSRTQPYRDLDTLADSCLRAWSPYRSIRRTALVAMLDYAQYKSEKDAATLGVIAPGGERRARMRDRRALHEGSLSLEEFDRRWGGVNIEG